MIKVQLDEDKLIERETTALYGGRNPMSKYRPSEEVSGRGQALQSILVLRVTNVHPILERVTAATSEGTHELTIAHIHSIPYSGLAGPLSTHVRLLRQIGAKLQPYVVVT